jgi:hypothetical protein
VFAFLKPRSNQPSETPEGGGLRKLLPWERRVAGGLAAAAALAVAALEFFPPEVTKVSANTNCVGRACAVKVSGDDSALMVALVGIAAATALIAVLGIRFTQISAGGATLGGGSDGGVPWTQDNLKKAEPPSSGNAERPLDENWGRITQLIDNDSQAAVLIAYLQVETALRNRAAQVGVSDPYTVPVPSLANELSMSRQLRARVRQQGLLRNEVAHRDYKPEVDEARQYVDSAHALLRELLDDWV